MVGGETFATFYLFVEKSWSKWGPYLTNHSISKCIGDCAIWPHVRHFQLKYSCSSTWPWYVVSCDIIEKIEQKEYLITKQNDDWQMTAGSMYRWNCVHQR